MLHYPMLPVVLVHGGASYVPENKREARKKGIKAAARAAYEVLNSSYSALDAVQEAVRVLEIDPQFNAGFGSVLTYDGKVEMEAAIMNGADLNAGCVSLVHDISHPIQLARSVMEKTRHKYLCGEGAMNLAIEEGMEILSPGALVTPDAMAALENYKSTMDNPAPADDAQSFEYFPYNHLTLEEPPVKHDAPGSVGAVAIDAYGNLAAAASTGGITGKMEGRIGDISLLGCGCYADNAEGAVVVAGQGETIMRYNVASRILSQMKHEELPPQDALIQVINHMGYTSAQTAGAIIVNREGHMGLYFTSPHMVWAYQRMNQLHYGIVRGEDNMELVTEPCVHFMK